MVSQQFISRIILIVFDKKAIDFQIKKWYLTSTELLEIRRNSLVMQWYAVNIYLSIKIKNDRLSEYEANQLMRMFNYAYMNYDFNLLESNDLKSDLLHKLPTHKILYDSVLDSEGLRDVLSMPYNREIGISFAQLCEIPESINLRRLGSNLFGNTLNKCFSNFKFDKIEFTHTTSFSSIY